jgi:lysophospholipase L1-like esterase
VSRILLLALLATWPLSSPTGEETPFVLADGDRVVLVGNTLIERDQSYGHLETLLTASYPDRTLTFRNLGWSGDTVWGEARAGFGSAEDGFRHLREHLLTLKPTVVIVGYGGNEAFAGEAGLPRFREGLARLLDTIAETKARVVILAPPLHEDLGPPLPRATTHNRDLMLYRDALGDEARKRGHRVVDLFGMLRVARPLTDDGIHLTDYGYQVAAREIAGALGLEPPRWQVTIDREGKVERSEGAGVKEVERSSDRVRFVLRADRLPGLLRDVQDYLGRGPIGAATNTLSIPGLAPGKYQLTIDGRPEIAAEAASWEAQAFVPGPDEDQTRRLREAIRKKNLLYFHRWRPQNETYLFGFRKHEQGQNAREIPQFDPLVAEQEAVIAKLRVPAEHTYELTRLVRDEVR